MSRRNTGLGSASNVEQTLARIHRLIMESAEEPSRALIKGKVSRSGLVETTRKLRRAIALCEEIIDA